jgi:hypothetical protein
MDLLLPLLTFLACVFGGGLLFTTFLRANDPLERLTLGLAAQLLAVFLLGFGTSILRAPSSLWLAWPASLALGLGLRRAAIRSLLTDPEIRAAFARWALFAAWGLGLLLCVKSYGGGYWTGDWLEHFERARFWQSGEDPQKIFLYGLYSLGARPPLANVVTAVLLDLSGGGFARYLVLNTLLGTLLIFPFTLLARRWAPGRAGLASTIGVVVLMLNPMVAQNLSFGWTRHFTAFWILLGLFLLLRGLASPAAARDRTLGFLALATAFLAHYSAGPFIVVAVSAHVWINRRALLARPFLAETACHAAVCGSLLALWFCWAFLHIGAGATFASNTTALSAESRTLAENAFVFLQNTRDTLVPHPFRDATPDPVGLQASAAGRARDFFFNLYQINLPLMFGFGGAGILLTLLARPGEKRAAWLVAIAACILLGIGVHTTRDALGVGHICLQPLVLLGLARVTALLAGKHRFATTLWSLGAAIDFTLGIAISFGLQTLRFGRLSDYGEATVQNAVALIQNKLRLPRDTVHPPDAVVLTVLVLALATACFAWWRASRRLSSSHAAPAGA